MSPELRIHGAQETFRIWRAVLFFCHAQVPLCPQSAASLERPPLLARSSWDHSFWLASLLCASLPSVLNYLALGRFCFVMAFTCSHSPHPARTVGSTLSISLWPWPHSDSLEIVLSQFYIFYVILGFPWSSLAHFLDQ